MKDFEAIYTKLNPEQRKAVDAIDGPLLVLAGPGTGKTQLLSARIANILDKTDAQASNILCLTFTEAAALNMRERLVSMIGELAYDVKIGTYHSFGSDVIKTYPEFFTSTSLDFSEDVRLERPIDDLSKRQILLKLAEALPYTNPLKSTQYHIGDLISTISELKRSLLTPDALRVIAKDNLRQIEETSVGINEAMAAVGKTMPRTLAKAEPIFDGIQTALNTSSGSLVTLAEAELTKAFEDANEQNKTTPLTKWKNNWLYKTADNLYSLTDLKLSVKLSSLADMLEAYAGELAKAGLYDFDDMILRAIQAIKENDELRFNLQEKYQYILLDEFQDTNKAQFELVLQLADNPVHENRPNIMAVGDDDQAIFAFQGAQYSNMLDFFNSFTDVKLINLTKNYRSHHDIIHTAHNVAGQIEFRLHHNLENIDKVLVAANDSLPKDADIERHEFNDRAEEYSWVAKHIAELVQSGEDASEIAVLAPKHKYLESLVPFLNAEQVAVTYEKRENILDTPIVRTLRLMSDLVLALATTNRVETNRLMPIVLSLPFWGIAPSDIWKVNWQLAKRDEERTWPEIGLEFAGQQTSLESAINLFLALSMQIELMPLEQILDILTGSNPLVVGEQEFRSPLKNYYFNDDAKAKNQLEFYETITQLSVIREKLREYQTGQETALKLIDFSTFFELYEQASQPLLNTHPISQSTSAVNLMTAFKSKGLEFKHVFLLSVHDNVWGASAKKNHNKLSLPANLKPIRHAGTEDELRRILFVAVTRAKQGLYLTSHAVSDSGKLTLPLKYLQEYKDAEQNQITQILPDGKNTAHHSSSQLSQTDRTNGIEILWHTPHTELQPSMESLLKEKLAKYQMSPTHINSFIDLHYSGPKAFLLNTLLRFPQAPTLDGEFGNAIHETLEWYHKQLKITGAYPSIESSLQAFEQRLKSHFIPANQFEQILGRGTDALTKYLAQRGSSITAHDASEHDFRSEGVLVNGAHLSGKIDRMIINPETKEITVVDYKTGESFDKWKSNLKLLKYRQQLYMYKLLIEGSHTYKGYTVIACQLEFVEPNPEKGTVDVLVLPYSEDEMEDLKKLIKAIWDHIQNVNFPDTSVYASDLSGSKQFMADLITGAI